LYFWQRPLENRKQAMMPKMLEFLSRGKLLPRFALTTIEFCKTTGAIGTMASAQPYSTDRDSTDREML
jgi:hypothetical protein